MWHVGRVNGKGYRVTSGRLSQHNVQLGVLPPVQDWLVFLGFDPEKVTPAISEPLGGYNVHVVHDMSQEHGVPGLAVVTTVESRAVLSL